MIELLKEIPAGLGTEALEKVCYPSVVAFSGKGEGGFSVV